MMVMVVMVVTMKMKPQRDPGYVRAHNAGRQGDADLGKARMGWDGVG